MIFRIIHQFDNQFKYEYLTGTSSITGIADNLKEAIDNLIWTAATCHTIITKDDIQYWEWDLALDIVVPSAMPR